MSTITFEKAPCNLSLKIFQLKLISFGLFFEKLVFRAVKSIYEN